ncbi:MAG: ABC-F family ATP-binding cassette domain-containing protein [Armatimonadota bacterium]
MPVLTVTNLSKYYGTEAILDHVALAVSERDRLGFIGANGTGKTTLCRILLGQEPCEDDSKIHFARGATVGYLSQDVSYGDATTPWEMVMTAFEQLKRRERRLAELTENMSGVSDEEQLHRLLDEHGRLLAQFEADGGYEYEHRAAGVLTRVGVPEVDFHRPLGSFSGGEQRRAALARLLLEAPDLLLLDEPTNHLDVEGIEWLEQYLRSYPGAVVAISHDRRFLDRVASRIVELEACDLTEYRGNYSEYLHQKEERLLVYERTYDRQQQERKKQLAFIRWALGTQQEKRVRAAKSRMKLLEKNEYFDPPLNQRRKMSIRFQPKVRGGEEILELTSLGMRYGDKALFSGVDLFIRRGERLGIVGPNGCGKSTLLKIALGMEQPSEGRARLGAVQVGYHRQQEFDLDTSNTVLQEFATVLPDAEVGELRSLLARFLFVEDDVFKCVGDLSGGEQSRLSLAKLVMKGPSLMVLDEPTNHLDIDSCNALENALKQYSGTIIVVSHDRYFLDNVVSRLLVFHEDNGTQKVSVHEGNYASWTAREDTKKAMAEALLREQQEAERQERQRQEKLARKLKQQRETGVTVRLSPEELETRIHVIEGQLARLEALLAEDATYDSPAYSNALMAEHQKLTEELTETYAQWAQSVE